MGHAQIDAFNYCTCLAESKMDWSFNFFMDVLLITAFQIMQGMATKDVFVSLLGGKDARDCGNYSSPCKSLRFTVEQIIKDHDSIHLDGGKDVALTYMIAQTINVKHRFQMKKWSISRFYPIITSGSTDIAAFLFLDAVVTNDCTLVQLNFLNTCLVTNGNLKLIDCTLNRTDLLHKESHALIFDFRIYRCKIDTSNLTLSNGFPFSMYNIFAVEESIFINSSVQSSFNRLTEYSFDGTYFRNTRLRLDTGRSCKVNGSFFKNSSLIMDQVVLVYVWNCEFYGHESKRMIYVRHYWGFRPVYHRAPIVVLKNNVFRENVNDDISEKTCVIEVNHSSRLDISGCIFLNNTGGNYGKTLCIIDVANHAVIENSTFTNNSCKRGGAVYVEGTVTISKSNFVNNSAWEYGGTIYSSDGSVKQAFNELRLFNVSIVGSMQDRYRSVIGRLIFSTMALNLKNVHLRVKFNTESSSVVYFKYGLKLGDLMKFHNYSMVCPVGHQALSFSDKLLYFTSACIPCNRGMYNLSHGKEYARVFGIDSMKSPMKRNNVTCSNCVPGGVCDSTITSAGNYWGFANKSGHVTFVPCPVNYCCSPSGTPCASYNTCEGRRSGRLCGSCKKGFSINFFSTDCVDDRNCSEGFYVLYIFTQFTTAVAYVLLLLWLKEIALFIKRCLSTNRIEAKEHGLNEPLLQNMDTLSSLDSAINQCGDNDEDDVIILTSPNNDSLDDTGNSNISKNLVSGLVKIIFFFYQVEPLLRISAPVKGEYRSNSWIIKISMSIIFNLKLSEDSNGILFCPSGKMTTLKKNILKLSFTFTLVVVLVVLYWIDKFVKFYFKRSDPTVENIYRGDGISSLDESVPTYAKKPFSVRVKCCAVKLSLLGYMAVSVFVFNSINCIPLDEGRYYLYIQADILCYTYWQWMMVGFLILWVVPYSASLYGASSLLISCRISPNEFLSVLIFPPLLLVFYLRNFIHKSNPLSELDKMTAKCMIMELYEPFKTDSSNKYAKWECLLIFRRLILVCATTFIINPIEKLYTVLALLVAFLLHHLHAQPYANEVLNLVESFSLIFLIVMTSVNLFWGHVYMTNDMNIPRFFNIAEVFLFLEMTVLLLPIFIAVLTVIFMVLKKVLHACTQQIASLTTGMSEMP